MNLHPDGMMSYIAFPKGPNHTTIVSEFFFRPETIAAPDFDPSGMVEFWDLVSKQDWAVVERAQTGVSSGPSPGASSHARTDSSTGSTRSGGPGWAVSRSADDPARSAVAVGPDEEVRPDHHEERGRTPTVMRGSSHIGWRTAAAYSGLPR